jgi:uncharacterized membrane protein
MIATASDLGVVLSGAGLFAVAISALAEQRLRDSREWLERQQQARVRRAVERIDRG